MGRAGRLTIDKSSPKPNRTKPTICRQPAAPPRPWTGPGDNNLSTTRRTAPPVDGAFDRHESQYGRPMDRPVECDGVSETSGYGDAVFQLSTLDFHLCSTRGCIPARPTPACRPNN
jgi:hypothetical protein